MRRCLTLLLILAGTARAADAPKANTLTRQEIADGWIQLFDGETTFGWRVEGEAKVENGELLIGGASDSAVTTNGALSDARVPIEFFLDKGKRFQIITNSSTGSVEPAKAGWSSVILGNLRNSMIKFAVSKGDHLRLRNVKAKPDGLKPIFNGKDLSGWKQYTGDEKRAKSKFTVTPEGWLNVTNGPGDLQTEKQWADFVFQGECISNGKHLNSGVFFRCIPGQYQQGYEFQIQNGYKDDDRTKPEDYGTGAIYRRVKARKVVSNDGEWFTMTLIAHGKHIRTWVNGYPTVDWTDDRKENNNAREGCKLGAGPISLQGHDPTTNLSFRNLRIAELKKE
jgi:hypothetical protein